MSTTGAAGPNLWRVMADRENRKKRGPLTPQGRLRLRQAALENRPWRFSTGPRSPEGKARVALNGRTTQKGPVSVRQLRAQLAELRVLIREMREGRELAGV
jgi:hypothetical protein